MSGMICVRAPHRISLFGGGSDISGYLCDNSAYIIGGAIDRYCYVAATFPEMSHLRRYRLSYAVTEESDTIEDIKHDLFREIIRLFSFNKPIHLSSFADVPSGTGLGTSSAFAVAAIKLISVASGIGLGREEIAQLAIEVERNILNIPGGFQDQYWSALGGAGVMELSLTTNVFAAFEFLPLFRRLMKESLVLVSSGSTRDSGTQALQMMDYKTTQIENVGNIQTVAAKVRHALLHEQDQAQASKVIADRLTESWRYKRRMIQLDARSEAVADRLEKAGLPMKLCGAGGAGMFAVWSREIAKVESALKGLPDLFICKPDVSEHGVTTIYGDNDD